MFKKDVFSKLHTSILWISKLIQELSIFGLLWQLTLTPVVVWVVVYCIHCYYMSLYCHKSRFNQMPQYWYTFRLPLTKLIFNIPFKIIKLAFLLRKYFKLIFVSLWNVLVVLRVLTEFLICWVKLIYKMITQIRVYIFHNFANLMKIIICLMKITLQFPFYVTKKCLHISWMPQIALI